MHKETTNFPHGTRCGVAGGRGEQEGYVGARYSQSKMLSTVVSYFVCHAFQVVQLVPFPLHHFRGTGTKLVLLLFSSVYNGKGNLLCLFGEIRPT